MAIRNVIKFECGAQVGVQRPLQVQSVGCAVNENKCVIQLAQVVDLK